MITEIWVFLKSEATFKGYLNFDHVLFGTYSFIYEVSVFINYTYYRGLIYYFEIVIFFLIVKLGVQKCMFWDL